jgi:hypothetical protein
MILLEIYELNGFIYSLINEMLASEKYVLRCDKDDCTVLIRPHAAGVDALYDYTCARSLDLG